MEGVVGRARAYDFGVDGRAARLSVLEAFQHEQARAFTHDKAVAVLVKGAGSLFGIVVVRRGERLQRGKAGNAHGRDGRFHAAGDAGVATAHDDLGIGRADGVRARSAGAGEHHVRALGTRGDGKLARGHVGDQHGDHEGGNLARPGLDEAGVEHFDGVQAAEPHAEDDADPTGVVVIDDEAGMLHQHVARGDGELDEAVHTAGLFGGNAVGFRIEPFDFAGNAGIKAGGVKEGDGPDARLPRKKIIPGFGDVAAERRQRRETGYNNAFAAHNSLMKQKVVERLMI